MRAAFCMEGILHDPTYLLGSHSPQLMCFSLANFFEILYNRIDMIVTGDWYFLFPISYFLIPSD